MGSVAPLLAAASALLGIAAVVDGRTRRSPWAEGSVRSSRPGVRPSEPRRDALRAFGRLPPGGAHRRLRASGLAPAELERAIGRARLLGLGSGAFAGLLGLTPPACVAVGLVVHRATMLGILRRGRERRRAAERELPVLLDLVASGVAAGLTGPIAVRHASSVAVGPLAEELAAALHRVELGGRWREELLAAADALGSADLRRAVAAVESGSSGVADAVAALAREVRETHRAAAAERARTAPVKMLFPLVFLVLPAFLLLTVAPVLVATLQSIR